MGKDINATTSVKTGEKDKTDEKIVLQEFLNRLDALKKTQNKMGPAEPATSAAVSKKQAERQVQEERYRDDIDKQINFQRSSLDAPPQFIKPVYFLENLAPLIKAKIRVPRKDDQGNEYVECIDFFGGGGTYGSNLSMDETPKPLYNVIKSMKIEYFGGGDASAKLTMELIDISQTFIDYMTLIFTTMQKLIGIPVLDIEFGWNSSKYLESKLNTIVNFTKHLSVDITDLEVKYTDAGAAEATLTGIVGMQMSNPFTEHRPYNKVGTQPGVFLCLIQLLKTIDLIMTPIKSTQPNSNNDRTGNISTSTYKSVLISLIKYLYLENVVRNSATMQELITLILNYYFSHDDASNQLAQQNKGSMQLIINTQIGQLNAGLQTYSTNAGSKTLPSVSSIDMGTLVEQLTKSSLGQTQSIKTGQVFGIDEFLNSNNPQTIVLRLMDKARKNQLQQNDDKRFVKLLEKIGIIASDMLIHPIYVLNYVQSKLYEAFKNDVSIKEKVMFRSLTHIDWGMVAPIRLQAAQKGQNNFNHFLTLKILDKKTTNITSETDSQPEQMSNYNYNYLTVEERIKWGSKASGFNIGPNDSWKQVIQDLFRQIYIFVQIDPQQKESYEKMSGIVDTGKEGSKIKASNYEYIPLGIKCVFDLYSPDNAIKSMQAYMNIVKTKIKIQKYKKENLKTINEVSVDTASIKKEFPSDIAIIDKINSDISAGGTGTLLENANKNRKQVMTMILDVAPVDNIFSPTLSYNFLLQAYSFRPQGNKTETGETDNQPNPGHPTAWNINFPDVLKFEPKFSIYQAMMSFNTMNAADVNATSGSMNITQKRKEIIQQLMKELEAEPKKDSEEYKTKLTQLDSEVNEYKTIVESPSYLINLESQNKIQLPVTFEQRDIYNGDDSDTLSIKKQMQQVRERLMLNGQMQVEASMTVLGDPNFDLSSGGKNIFVKFINPDGKLSPLTGLYSLTGAITHELSGSGFTTSFNLMKVLADIDFNNQLATAIYGRDILKTEFDDKK